MKEGTLLHERYLLDARLGQGGMGAVWRGRDRHLQDKAVALKHLLPPPGDPSRELMMKLFEREARLLSRLSHPGLVRITDAFEEEGVAWVVMDLIEGKTLTAHLRAGPVEVARAVAWARQLCDVLQYLHQQEPPVIWRDAKPDNIMVDADGRVRVIDFGIARIFRPTSEGTTAGLGLGSPGYAPVEQYGGGDVVDPRADIYSLGATLYTMLTVTVPPPSVDRYSGVELVPPSRLNPTVPPHLEQLILRMMAVEAAARPQSVAEVLQALDAPREQKVAPSMRIPRWLFAALLPLALGAWWLSMPGRLTPEVYPDAGAIRLMFADHDGSILEARGESGTLALRPLTPDEVSSSLTVQAFPLGLADLSISTDQSTMAGIGTVGDLRCWTPPTNVPPGQQRALQVPEDRGRPLAVALKPDGDGLAVTERGCIAFFSPDLKTTPRPPIVLTDQVTALRWSPDGAQLAVVIGGREVRFYDAKGDQPQDPPLELPAPLKDMVWDHTGDRLVTATADGALTIWDAATRHTITTRTAHAGGANALAFSASGGTLVSGGADAAVRFWAYPALTPERVLDASQPVTAVAISAADDQVAAGTRDHLLVWHLPQPLP
ncbi:MAG: WD40 repeat domain-containing serine/threonine protein kinase [Candidatus Xenobia bacterium]